jgi:hypothetical protein
MMLWNLLPYQGVSKVATYEKHDVSGRFSVFRLKIERSTELCPRGKVAHSVWAHDLGSI